MKKLLWIFLLASAFGQTFNTNIIPAQTGLSLGRQGQRWNLYASNLDITGSITVNGVAGHFTLLPAFGNGTLAATTSLIPGTTPNSCAIWLTGDKIGQNPCALLVGGFVPPSQIASGDTTNPLFCVTGGVSGLQMAACPGGGGGGSDATSIRSNTVSVGSISTPGQQYTVIAAGSALALQEKAEIDCRDYGCIADGQVATDAYCTSASATLTAESAHWSAGDVGKQLVVYGCGPTTSGYIQPLSTTISAYVSPTQITMGTTASNSTFHSNVTISAASRAGIVGQAISTYTATAHGFSAGQRVNVAMTNAADQSYSGLFTIATVPDANHFTVGTWMLPATAATGGGTADGHSERALWGTDNTAAAQASVDAAGDRNGGSVWFPGAAAGTSWTGLYLIHGLSLPCSVSSGTYNSIACTRAYNNIVIHGDGIGKTQFENWDIATSGTTYHALLSFGRATAGLYFNTVNKPLTGMEVYGLTLRQIRNQTAGTGSSKILRDDFSDGMQIHDVRFEWGSVEGLYIAGTNYRVYNNQFYGVGLPGLGVSTSLSALNLNGAHIDAWDNKVLNSGQCMEGAGYDNRFYNNVCDGRGPDKSSAGSGGGLGINLSSATYGIWDWKIGPGNTFYGQTCTVENVNGILSNVFIEGNTFIDISGGCLLGGGKEANNVTYWPATYQSIHGPLIMRNNSFINDGLMYVSTFPLATGGNQTPLLSDVTLDGNTFSVSGGQCAITPHEYCTQNADCSGGGSCYAPTLLFSSAAAFNRAWQASTSYLGLSASVHPAVVAPVVPNGFIYMNKGATGTSNSSEPSWCTTLNCTVTDSGVTWTAYSKAPSIRINNTSMNSPSTLASFNSVGLGSEITLPNGMPRSSVLIRNFRPTVSSKISNGNTGDTPSTETIAAGATYSDGSLIANGVTLAATGIITGSEVSAPSSPAAGLQKLYFKAGVGVCSKDSAGVEYCPGGSGLTFATITAGTNTTAAMLVGTGASLAVSGSGTIAATTAAAFTSNPTDCTTNQFAHTIAANGNLTCAALTLAGAQFANQGTTTTVLHGNAAGNPSFGAVVGADMTANTVTATQLAAQYSKWLVCIGKGLGDGLNAIPAGTYLASTCRNLSGVTVTITGIQCFTDNNGTSTMAVTNGAGTALLTGAVTCNNSYASGTQSATVTLANNDFLKFTYVADGTSKQFDANAPGTF